MREHTLRLDPRGPGIRGHGGGRRNALILKEARLEPVAGAVEPGQRHHSIGVEALSFGAGPVALDRTR